MLQIVMVGLASKVPAFRGNSIWFLLMRLSIEFFI